MKRKVLILIGSIFLILAACGVYYLLAGSGAWIARENYEGARGDRPEGRHTDEPGRMAMEKGEGLNVEVRDSDGRLEAVYQAPKWTKREDNSYILYEPTVRLFRTDGQRGFIRGDHAIVYVEEVADGVNVRRGSISGNVKFIMDRTAGPDRSDLAEEYGQLKGLIKIYTEDMYFDNNALELSTEGRIELFAPEVDIVGHGLEIMWNDSPRELRLLKIRRGRYMAVYNVPDELKMMSQPGGAASELPRTVPDSAPATMPVGDEPDTLQIVDAGDGEGRTTTQTATQPTTSPATAQGNTATKQRPARNIYLAKFTAEKGAIHVDFGSNKMRGAETLSLKFRWDTTRRRFMEGPAQPVSQVQPLTTAPGEDEASTRPAETQPEKERPREKTQPMIITWNGPLVISPQSYTSRPEDNMYDLSATGKRLVLSEPQGKAYCNKIEYHYPRREGELIGREGSPVRLEMAGGDYAVCRRIIFTPGSDRAVLHGKGYMQRTISDSEGDGGASVKDAIEFSADKPRGERIEWSKAVNVKFGQFRPAPGESPKRYIKEAVFLGDVELTRPAAKEFVRCPKLRVLMRPAGGKVQPTEALATGGVTAHQADNDIEAQSLSIVFDRADESSSIRPVRLVGDGGVKITDTSDPQQKVVATAERLTSNLVEQEAVLTGGDEKDNRFAKIRQGDNFMAGREIRLARRTERASVRGAGEIEYLSERDINGRELEKPRPVKITFAGGMDYNGSRNEAEFRKKVELVSRSESMKCDRLSLLFRKSHKAEEGTSTEKPRDDSADGVGFGVERFARRKVSMILADGNVEFTSRRQETDTSKLLTRMKLSADEAMFDARPGTEGEESHEIHVIGQGTLVFEDYRPPQEKSQRAPDNDSFIPRGQKPLQAVFNWKKFMTLHQKSREVRMKGDVKVVYRSASQVVGTDRLNVPDWGDLPPGRRTVLLCNNLTAGFDPPDTPADTDAVRTTGPPVGDLRQFTATEDVNLTEGPWQFLGEVMIYNRHPEDRDKDLVILRGHMPGKPVADANLFYEDGQTGQSQKWASPQILFYPGSQRVETGKVTGGGVR